MNNNSTASNSNGNGLQLQQLLDHFKDPRKVGDSWLVHCPAHDDRKRSLSICEKNGRVLLYCHAGCEYWSILDALNLSTKEKAKSDRVINRYVYTDEQGNPLFRVCRTDKDIPMARGYKMK